jgi:hypothetical protein
MCCRFAPIQKNSSKEKSEVKDSFSNIKRFFLFAIFMAGLTALTPAPAQARTYDVLTADVPFKFDIGERTFGPGQYQFIFVANGLLAVRDSHAHVIASMITRSRDAGTPAPATKLVFATQNNHTRLTAIHIEHSSDVLEVVREQVAVTRAPSPPASIPMDTFFVFGTRTDGFRLRY